MLRTIRARRERRRREQWESGEDLRKQQEAAEERLGIDPAELEAELDQAEAAPFLRGPLGWVLRRQGERQRR